MKNQTNRGAHLRYRELRPAMSRSSFIIACATTVCAFAAMHEVRAAPADAAGYTPTLYVYQKNELVDVKTFKVADREGCQRRAEALLELYLNHSDIEDDMRLVVGASRSRRRPPVTVRVSTRRTTTSAWRKSRSSREWAPPCGRPFQPSRASAGSRPRRRHGAALDSVVYDILVATRCGPAPPCR